MILFLVKKTFFDMWDNLLSIFLLNVGSVLIVAGGLYLVSFSALNVALFVFGVVLALWLLCLYTGIVAMMARDIANYTTPEFQNIVPYLKQTWKASTLLTMLIALQVLLVQVVMRWYLGWGNLPGLAIASLLFWVSLTWWLASQYFYPIRAQLDDDLKKVFKKCFVVFFDNTLFSLGLAIGSVVILLLSSLVMFLIPGMAVLLLWHQSAVKLRMLKYDYLESHPNADRRRIPWADLLSEERERLGPRSLRGMIFPWKE